MKIEDKMRLVFNNELKENKILTIDEKKVLAALMYDYKVSHKAGNGIVAKAMKSLRNDIGIDMTSMYDAVRNLEFLYGMFERQPGEKREKGKKAMASEFKLNFDKILNPPVEAVKFDFSDELKSSETSINNPNPNPNTNSNTKSKTNTNSNTKSNSNTNTNTNYNTKLNTNKNQLSVEDFEIDTTFTEYKPKESDGLKEYYAEQLGLIIKQSADVVKNDFNLLS